MGLLYRARDQREGVPVALKVVVAGADVVRFEREGRLLAAVAHDTIVKHVAHGVEDGSAYLAMEWLDGEDLAQRLARGPLSVAETLVLARRVAAALAEIHARGLLHRDIKPANIFLSGGELAGAKVVDFGLARHLVTGRHLTRAGDLLGTPGYLAPEQARGQPDLDARADIFSLGCVLHEALTGTPVFQGEHALALLAKLIFEDSTHLQAVRADVPDWLDGLIAAMLEKEPARRPRDGAAVLAALVDPTASPRSGRAATISGDEQRIVTVLVAGAGDAERGETLAPSEAARRDERIATLEQRFGARLVRVGGHHLSVLRGEDALGATAGFALALATILPESPLALATGRGVLAGRLPVGDALDRAVQLATTKRPGVWLDAVSARLLEARFRISPNLELLGTREREETRTLVGKRTTCVGRERELATLDAVFAQCAAESQASALLVVGPAGAGKSRLRAEWLERLRLRRESVRVLAARGEALSTASPFGLAVQLLRSSADEPLDDYAAIERHLARVVAPAELRRVAIFLAELLGVAQPPEACAGFPELDTARASSVAMAIQLRLAWEEWLRGEAARSTVVAIVDNLHWGDLPSVNLLDAALAAARDLPLMVVGLGRAEVQDRFPDLWGRRDRQELRIAELSRRASERLVREVLPDATDAAVARMCEGAGGNALFLEELIRAVAEGRDPANAPPTVLALIQARLAELPGKSRRALRAASVFGDVFWRGGVAAVAGEAASILDDLCVKELISARRTTRFAGEEEYVFRHAFVRNAAYGLLTNADRELAHRLAAHWLGGMDDRDAMTLAEHLERGGEASSAIAHYRRAASQALDGNDFPTALTAVARGVTCGATGEDLGALLYVRATAHRWAGRFAEAEEPCRQALVELPRRTDLWYRAAGLYQTIGEGRTTEMLEPLYEEVRALAPDEKPSPEQALAWAYAATELFYLGDYGLANLLLAAAERFRAFDQHPLVAARIHRALAARAVASGDPADAGIGYSRAMMWFRRAGDFRNSTLDEMNGGEQQALVGKHEVAIGALEHARTEAERLGLPYNLASTIETLAFASLVSGDLARARSLAMEALRSFEQIGQQRMLAWCRLVLAMASLDLGDLDHAHAQALAVESSLPPQEAVRLAVLSMISRKRGDVTGAVSLARRAMEIVESLGHLERMDAAVRLAYVDALAASGDTSGARTSLTSARAHLIACADRIRDEKTRRTFLENVRDHAETMRRS
jgi:tetratricopeptide (TPR) repeat protein